MLVRVIVVSRESNMFYSWLLAMFGLWSFGALVRVAGLLEKNSVDQQRCLAAVHGRVGIILTKLLQWLGLQ